jgi:outer membrane immunogenic protein
MKHSISLKLLCAGVALGALAAGPVLADPPGDWRGPYVGGYFGGNFADFGDHFGNRNPSGSDSSFLAGGDVGANWQYNHLVWGVEGDFSKIDNNSGAGGVKFTEDWMSTARARLGYGIDRFLPYVTGGLAVTDTVAKVSGVGSAEALAPGAAIGGGVDMMIANNWFGRVEYLHTDVPQDSAVIGGTRVTDGSGNDAVRIGVNYKF